MVTVQYMWIDDTSADVIKVDFEALYHGDFLIEGDTSEQFPDLAPRSDRASGARSDLAFDAVER